MVDFRAALEGIERFLDERLPRSDAPGAVVALTDREQFLGATAVGVADMAAERPMQVDDRFQIGSISKSFAAIIAVQEVEAGRGDRGARRNRRFFWVSSGPPQVDVPDVVGLSQGDASAVLEEAGFIVSTDYVAGWGEFPGTVTAQDPVAGVRGRSGDEVIIQVAVF